MFDRAIQSERIATRRNRTPYRMRDGHRREYDPRRDARRCRFGNGAAGPWPTWGSTVASRSGTSPKSVSAGIPRSEPELVSGPANVQHAADCSVNVA